MDYPPEFFEPDYFVGYPADEYFYEESLQDVWKHCVLESLLSISQLLYKLLLTNICFGIIISTVNLPETLFHVLSGCGGLILIINLLDSDYGKFIIIFCFISTYTLLYINKKFLFKNLYNYSIVFIYILCQYFFLDDKTWLEIRGLIMIFVMKIISLLSNIKNEGKQEFPNFIQYFGYVFCSANVMFGPWMDYQFYIKQYYFPSKKNIFWIVGIVRSLLFAMFFLAVSNCWSEYFIPEDFNRFLQGYKEALSFRTSHYFICYLSEATMIASGWKNVEDWYDEGSWNFFITNPLVIEFPTSLAVVVINWNKPMHIFLKKYVYKPCLPLGKFYSLLLTFIISSFLHGFEIKVSTVLIFIGIFSYLQLLTRDKVSKLINSCVRIYPCRKYCYHNFKRNNLICKLILLVYSFTTVLHLIYLGILMDPTTDEIGIYEKWRNLYFISFWLMLANMLIIWLIGN